jgi:pimeloyl-ACP methyl ester carboxylesterase
MQTNRAASCAAFMTTLALANLLFGGAKFHVTVDPTLRPEPSTGRLVVYLINENSRLGRSTDPADGPFFEDPQPMFGIDVANFKSDDVAIVDDSATSFPGKPGALPAGKYVVQAVLDMHHDNSRWDREPGNLYSQPLHITTSPTENSRVDITLNKIVLDRKIPQAPGADLYQMQSKLLSDFHHRPITLRAGVMFPQHYDRNRFYPAVYEIPGFGGDAMSVFSRARRNGGDGDDPRSQLSRSAFWIILDPESGNGHTLFANSENNGPCGDALVRELIPALEKQFHLIDKTQARLLRGHSSGGWSSLWLAMQYPEVFSAAWASSPDPVDLHKFQLVDIYSNDNMYSDGNKDWPSVRSGSMTIRQENLMEEVLGPNNTSGQQWDSWQAAWGRRDASGRVAVLYDPITGKIDHGEAETYHRYDINELLKSDPQKFGPIFKQRIRLIVGGKDTFFLNEAVTLLKPEVDKLKFAELPEGENGYVKILPGFDHGSIHMAPEFVMIPQEMLEHLRRNGFAP